MKHKELIELLYRNREQIVAIEKGENREDLNEELIQADFFVKFGGKFILNDKYQDFVNFMLQRVDYGIIFGNYENEHKELIDLKNRFLKNDSNQDFYLNQILKLIKNLFMRFRNRDKEINLQVEKFDVDDRFDIDFMIEIAENALIKIREFSIASGKVGNLLRTDLKGLNQEIDQFLKSTNYEISIFHDNIHKQIERILYFILSGKDRIRENKKLENISELILEDRDSDLENYLILKSNKLFFTIYQEKKLRYDVFPKESEFDKLSEKLAKKLNLVEVKLESKEVFLEKPKVENIKIPNIDEVVQYLNQNGSDDIFTSIANHQELENSSQNDIFKMFFKVVTYKKYQKHIKLTEQANNQNIRIIKWA